MQIVQHAMLGLPIHDSYSNWCLLCAQAEEHAVRGQHAEEHTHVMLVCPNKAEMVPLTCMHWYGSSD